MFASLVSQSYNYSAPYRAALNYVAVDSTRGVPPFLFQDRLREDVLLRAFITNGAWAQTDQMAFLTSYGDSNWALMNMVNPGTRNLSGNGNFLYTMGKGFSSQGDNASYIDTNFIPNTHGVNYTKNAAGMITYCPTVDDGRNSINFVGGADAGATNELNIDLRNSTDTLSYKCNSSTGNTVANTTTKGLYHIRRTSSTALAVYKDGSSIASVSRTTTNMPSNSIVLGALNTNGTIGNATRRYIGFWMIGGSYNGLESSINSAWSTYLSTDAFDTVSFPTFPSYTTYSDLSAYTTAMASMPDGFSYTKPVIEILAGSITSSSLQYQGLVTGSNDVLYGITASGTTILRVDVSTSPETITQIGSISAGAQKYGSGCKIGDKIYFCPYNAKSVLVIDTTTDTISYFDTTGATAGATVGTLTGSNKWWGFYIGSDGFIYGMAYDATEVIKINPATNAITFIDGTGTVSYGAGNLTGTAKWDSGICYGDFIYGSCSSATDMCKVDVLGGTVSRVASYAAGANKYAILSVLPNGKILMGGYNNTDCQIFDTSNNTSTTAGGASFAGSAPHDLIHTIMPDGKVLMFNTATDISGRAFYLYDPVLNSVSFITGNTIPAATQQGLQLAYNGYVYSTPASGGRFYKVYYAKKTLSPPVNLRYSRYNAR